MAAEFKIGHLARKTGCKVATIRYYEQVGLLPAPGRTPGNTRVYGPGHLARLAFIRHCRELGLAQPAIRELLELTDQPDRSCAAVTEIARAQLADLNRRIARLDALKCELEHMISACAGGTVAQCRIIETLSGHTHCLTDEHPGNGRP